MFALLKTTKQKTSTMKNAIKIFFASLLLVSSFASAQTIASSQMIVKANYDLKDAVVNNNNEMIVKANYDVKDNLMNNNSLMIVKSNINTADQIINLNSNNMITKSNFNTPDVMTDIYINNDAVACK